MDQEERKNYEEKCMGRALCLAKKGMGRTSPNPMVGCVVAKDGRILAEGYHEHYGGFHAERNALLSCGEEAEGADLFVTLEPCCHYGKTPPCTDIILEKKIGRVIIGSLDPNPLVGGRGAAILREQGVEVATGVLEEECLELNRIFFHYIKTGRPYFIMKYAMTLDGKIAGATGDSKWITGKEARNHVQQLRKRARGILAGIGTVMADDPMLNVRVEQGVDPMRIILDTALRIPLESRIVKTACSIPTIVACKEGYDREKGEKLRQAGVELLVEPGKGWGGAGVPGKPGENGGGVFGKPGENGGGVSGEPGENGGGVFGEPGENGSGAGKAGGKKGNQPGRISLGWLAGELGKKQIDSVLVEGGSQIHGSFLRERLVDEACVYIAPKLAGKSSFTPIEGWGIGRMEEAFLLDFSRVEQIGEDLFLMAYPRRQKA